MDPLVARLPVRPANCQSILVACLKIPALRFAKVKALGRNDDDCVNLHDPKQRGRV